MSEGHAPHHEYFKVRAVTHPRDMYEVLHDVKGALQFARRTLENAGEFEDDSDEDGGLRYIYRRLIRSLIRLMQTITEYRTAPLKPCAFYPLQMHSAHLKCPCANGQDVTYAKHNCHNNAGSASTVLLLVSRLNTSCYSISAQLLQIRTRSVHL